MVHTRSQAYKSDGVPASADAVGRLQAVLSVLPRARSDDTASREALLEGALAWADSAITWTARCDAATPGHPLGDTHMTNGRDPWRNDLLWIQ